MDALCFICRRAASGFSWCEPPEKSGPTTAEYRRTRKKTFLRFCSMACMDIHCNLFEQEVVVVKTSLELKAENLVIGPLADYVCSVGSDKALEDYSKPEIHGLIDTVLESYHSTLQKLYEEEIPF